MVIYDRFGNELPTEAVFARYHFQSSKAIYLEFQNGLFRWIPKSMIDNLEEFDHSNLEDFMYFEIARFLVEKNEIPIEY